jgi:hypothetical protein
MPLHEALATALDLAEGERLGARSCDAVEPPSSSWPGGQHRRFRRSDIVVCRIGMAPTRILLNLDEGSVLGRVVFP